MEASRHARSLLSKIEGYKSRLEHVREKADQTIGHTLQAAEVAGSAWGFAYAEARFGKGKQLMLMGLPANLTAGLTLHGVALLGGVSAKYADHVHNIADGCLAHYAVSMGARMGAQAAVAAPPTTGFQPAGQFRTGYQPASAVGYAPAGTPVNAR